MVNLVNLYFTWRQVLIRASRRVQVRWLFIISVFLDICSKNISVFLDIFGKNMKNPRKR